MTDDFTGSLGAHGNAARMKRFRETHPTHNTEQNAYKKKRRAEHIPLFVGVDSEGINTKNGHIAILLGCGNESIVATDRRRGLFWAEVFEFLYGQFQSHPKGTVFVGFYLKYDFNEWLKSLPEKVARALLSPDGKAARKVTRKQGGIYRKNYRSVHYGGWEIDIIGFKSLSIRPDVCDCHKISGAKCPHEHPPFMHICDAGPFFQTSFLNVIQKWPEVRSDEELATITYGKETLRANASWRDLPKMRKYNALENEILSRCMHELCKGFRELGIFLPRDKWYGPGAVAQAYLRSINMSRHDDLVNMEWLTDFLDAAQKSYYGGWFEIFSHGIIRGTSYNYDINSAYPYASTMLPHICERSRVQTGTGKYTGNGRYVLLHCSVSAKSDRIGPVPHRNSNGSICRPNISKGWHWKSELDAANRAGIVRRETTHEWIEFVPCDHPNPLAGLYDLYNLRLRVGKNTPLGKAIKLLINSIYGKFAQSIGGKPYNNWFYASYITSSCRTQILDAIASHPRKADSVLMVATDGICFDQAHPSLTLSTALGEWEESAYTDVVLFKPGVYWHKEGVEALLKIKSRGVPAKAFAEAIELMEAFFQRALDMRCAPGTRNFRSSVASAFHMENDLLKKDDEGGIIYRYGAKAELAYLSPEEWPCYPIKLPFRMTSVSEAINQNDWSRAGKVYEDHILWQNSYPGNKRGHCWYDTKHRRFDSSIKTVEDIQTKYYDARDHPEKQDLGIGLDMAPMADIVDLVTITRDRESRYDIEIDEDD